jgi:2-polyprenyl-3-methyl-5-hydroxy-6-metoxy-1,4-benzoquinol methylase
VFAQHFDIKDIKDDSKFELLTAFEVFEHLENPLSEIEKMLQYSDSILFSTLLQPKRELKSVNDWWYFAPETGQHISFYTKQSLLIIAKRFGLNLYTNGWDLHLLTTKKLPINTVKYLLYKKIVKLIKAYLRRRKSLIQSDVEHIKRLI